MNNQIQELCPLNIELYRCVSSKIDTTKVILTDKQLLHMADRHPEAYNDVRTMLNDTISDPDYIIRDENHENTGLIIKEISSANRKKEHSFIILRICTNSNNGLLANSVISGWKISNKRLQNYLRNKSILYKRA